MPVIWVIQAERKGSLTLLITDYYPLQFRGSDKVAYLCFLKRSYDHLLYPADLFNKLDSIPTGLWN